MEEEIESKFEERGFVSDIDEAETFQKCLNFCINFKLVPSDLVSSWEVYYLNRQLNEYVLDSCCILQNEVRVREAVIKEEPNLHILLRERYRHKVHDLLRNKLGSQRTVFFPAALNGNKPDQSRRDRGKRGNKPDQSRRDQGKRGN